MTTADLSYLDILLHGELVGTLTRMGSDRTLFAFTEEYEHRSERPTLSLSFRSATGTLLADQPTTQLRLLPFFSNLLPEGHLRRYLADRARVNPSREFFLLAELGSDLPGAVQALPSKGIHTAVDTEDTEGEEALLRFSLAGVELKFSVVHEAAGGLTIPASGEGGSWIVKLPSRQFPDVPTNEFSMMSLAGRLGISIPEIRLVDLASIGNLPILDFGRETTALALRRFDRAPGGERIHMEDLAQVFGQYPEDKYGKASYRNIASVLAVEAPEDLSEFVRRLTFSFLVGNADLHLKNWSLIYPDRVRARLSPAYDLVSTVAYLPDDNAALRVSRSRRFADFDEDELRHLCAKAGIPERLTLEVARETVDRFHAEWERAKRELPISREVAVAVERQAAIIPMGRR